MALHSSDSLIFNPKAPGTPFDIAGLTSMAFQLNPETFSPEDGNTYDRIVVINSESPEVPFETTSLGPVLDNVGLGGVCVDYDGSHEGLTCFAQKHERCGVDGRAADGQHMSVTIPYGHLFLEQISGQSGGSATATLKMYALKKPTDPPETKPYVVAYNASLPVDPVETIYGLGKPRILGLPVDRVQSVNVAFNPTIEKTQDAESIWPTDLDLGKIKILTTIVTRDPEWFESAGRIPGGGFHLTGTVDTFSAAATYAIGDYVIEAGNLYQATSANGPGTFDAGDWNNLGASTGETCIYFLQAELDGPGVSGGRYKDFASAVHTKGLLRGLAYVSTHFDYSGAATGTTTIQIAGYETAGVKPVIWDTTSTYP